MSTYKRGRTNKLEVNLTSSFIAGGTQYTHHPDSLVASYRFEEPFAVHVTSSDSRQVKDHSGNDRHASINVGTYDPVELVPEDELCLAKRSVEETPYLFSKNKLRSSGLTSLQRLTSPNSISGEQIRVLQFLTGSSERVDFPESFTTRMNLIDKKAISYESQMLDSGATYAFWIRLDGDDALFSTESVPPLGYPAKNPYVARNIFSVDRENYFENVGLEGDEIDFGRAFSIRAINDASSIHHRKISIVATYDTPESTKIQFEWVVDKVVQEQTWTHIAIIFPHTFRPLDPEEPLADFVVEPKAMINGETCLVISMPVDVKNKITLSVDALDVINPTVNTGLDPSLDLPGSGSMYPNTFIDLCIKTPFSESILTSLLRLNTAHLETGPLDIFPSASIVLSAGFNSVDNHLSTFTIRDTLGKEANFVIDTFHTGAVSFYFNGNATVESPQMVNPNPGNLPVVEIQYDPYLTTDNDLKQPADLSYLRLTTANNKTQIYMFDESVSTPTIGNIVAGADVKVATTANLQCVYDPGVSGEGATLTSIDFVSINELGIDSVTSLAVSDVVLVKNQTEKHGNGIYVITDLGNSGSSSFVLTRRSDYDEITELSRWLVFSVTLGTLNAGKKFLHVTPTDGIPGSASDFFYNMTGIYFEEYLIGPSKYSLTTLRPKEFNSGSPVIFEIFFSDQNSEETCVFVNDETTAVSAKSQAISYTVQQSPSLPSTHLSSTITFTEGIGPSPGSYVNFVSSLGSNRTISFVYEPSFIPSPGSGVVNVFNHLYDTNAIATTFASEVNLLGIDVTATVITASVASDVAIAMPVTALAGIPSCNVYLTKTYKIGVLNVTGTAEYANRIYSSLETALTDTPRGIDVQIGNLNLENKTQTIREETRQNILDSSTIPLYLRHKGDPRYPENSPGNIKFFTGSVYFDSAFNKRFSMGAGAHPRDLIFNSGSISDGFQIGSSVFTEPLKAEHVIRNYSGFPFFDKSRNIINNSCVNGEIIETIGVGHPIFVFGRGDSIEDNRTINNVSGLTEGLGFLSNRYIKTTVPLTSDALVRFSVIPAKSTGNFVNTISRKLSYSPIGDDKGLHVQFSADGNSWFSADKSMFEVRRDGQIVYARTGSIDPTSLIGAVSSTTPLGTAALPYIYSKITSEDFVGDYGWQHYVFYLDAKAIIESAPGAFSTQSYYVRIIQEGYDASYSDNWAITNLTVEGKFSHGIRPQIGETISLIPISAAPEDTWDALVDAVNDADGHDGEIVAEHLPAISTVRFTLRSPPGIISDGISGGEYLTGSIKFPNKSLTTNKGFCHSLSRQSKVKLVNFDGGGSSASHNTHIRIGVKNSSFFAAYGRLLEIINSSRFSYAESKILGNSVYAGDRLSFSSNFLSGTSYTILNPTRPDGLSSTGWQLSGFTNYRFAKSIGFYGLETNPDYLELATARIAAVINQYSSSFGLRAWATASLGSELVLEHTDNNTLADQCNVSVFSASNYDPPARTITQITTPGGSLFADGVYGYRTLSDGSYIVDFGRSQLGTSPNDLSYYVAAGIPGFVSPSDTLPLTSFYASNLGGRTPKCMIDDFAVWSRCLIETEIRAIFNARRGAYAPISGLSSFDPRVQIGDEDNLPGIYPTNSRITDEDFGGRFPAQYSADNEIISRKPYSTAEFVFLDQPLAKSNFTITDWKGASKTFRFIKSEKDKSLSSVNVYLESTLAKTVETLAKRINSFASGNGSGFGIDAKVTAKNRILLTQAGIGAETGWVTGNTTITRSKGLNCQVPARFSGDGFKTLVEYPTRINENHPLMRRMVSPGHARSTLSTFAPTNLSPEIESVSSTIFESISPYSEDSQFAAFGTSLHADADTDYLDSNSIGPRGSFWLTGTDIYAVGVNKTGPTWAKHKIEIDLEPLQKTRLFKHLTTGSTTAYFNFETKNWEPIGTISRGAHLQAGAGSNERAQVKLIVNEYAPEASTSIFSGDTLTNRLLFSLTDSIGRTISFIGTNEDEIGVTGQAYKRFNSSLYGVATDGTIASPIDNIYDAVNTAFLIGDLNIRPEVDEAFISDPGLVNGAINLTQVDFGFEGNTTIGFQNVYLSIVNDVLSSSIGFFPIAQTAFNTEDQIFEFQGGESRQEETASEYGRQSIYSLTGTKDPRDENFRRWLDTATVGFGPSIGLSVIKSSDGAANVTVYSGSSLLDDKYVFLDGGIAKPVSTFGFPFHPKFYATGSQTLDVNGLIDRPFLVEKIAYEFRANLYESASIQTFQGGSPTTSASYGSESSYTQSAYINIPTPTFFILNQRKCHLPYDIVNDMSIISLADESGPAIRSFQYTASIPSSFYLTSQTNGSGPITNVDSARDLVTFARLASAPHALLNDDFESFVEDPRKLADLVLVPNKSIEAEDDLIFVQETHPEASFTIASPVRAPRRSQFAGTFRTEGDYFGSSKTEYTFEVDPGLIEAPVKTTSDALIIEDAAGTVRRFLFMHGAAASVEVVGLSDFSGFYGLGELSIDIEDSFGNIVTFEFRTDILLNQPVKVDSMLYRVGIAGVSATSGPVYSAEVCESFAAAINLSYANEDLDVFAVNEQPAAGSVTLYQGTPGEDGNTALNSTSVPPMTVLANKEFENGSSTLTGGPIYSPYGTNNNWLSFDAKWLIPVNKNIAAPGGAEYYASKFYEALSVASRESFEYGGFKVPFELQTTGTAPTNSFTFKQSVGGQRGLKTITDTNDFEDTFTENDLGVIHARYASVTVTDEGEIQNDSIVLDWAGNRTGIPAITSGRSPLGGENYSSDITYTSNDGSRLSRVEHAVTDYAVSPYLLMPGDNLVFGWQSPIGTGSHVHHVAAGHETHGSFEILPGAGKLVLYGSILQNDQEKSHVTSNQPLTSEAVHEAIFSDADVYDIYDTDPYIYHFDNTLDQYVDGLFEMNTVPPQLTRQVVSRASEGNHAVGPKDGSYPIFSKRAGFLRGFKAVDSNETLFDSMTPGIDELMSRDNIFALDPGYGDGGFNAKSGVVVLAHPSLVTSSDDYDYSNSCWHKWMASYPFEPRYSGLARYEGFKTGLSLKAVSGSFVSGLKPIKHVWLANNSNTIRGYRDADAAQEDFLNMLNNIEKPRLFLDSSANTIASRPQPYNINFSVVTDESGEGPPGEVIDALDFAGKFLGTKIGPRSKYFFSRLFFGTGDGTYRFPKLPYWKNIFVEPGQGFDLNETFPVTRGVIIRGFKYGLANVVPTRTSAIFRRDRFGHFRDQLEQRLFTKTYTKDDATSDNTPIVIQFRSRADGSIVDPSETNSANLSLYCTSSIPYNDGVYLDRFNLSPDDRTPSNVVYTTL